MTSKTNNGHGQCRLFWPGHQSHQSQWLDFAIWVMTDHHWFEQGTLLSSTLESFVPMREKLMNNSSICRAITAADILRLEVAKTKMKSNPQPLGLKLVIDLLLYSSLVPRDSSRIQLNLATLQTAYYSQVSTRSLSSPLESGRAHPFELSVLEVSPLYNLPLFMYIIISHHADCC